MDLMRERDEDWLEWNTKSTKKEMGRGDLFCDVQQRLLKLM